jgi:L-threonylcarbamoyladenylate synthase
VKVLLANVANISLAAKAIREGLLVIMPTETVYGLACDATNEEAVARVYAAKARPRENPLIVHIESLDDLDRIAAEVSPEARRLTERFWPGPLTIVFPKAKDFPGYVTGGLDTVAVRMPAHPVALSLIKRSGTPLAAPSANPFMGLSPTRIEHLDLKLVKDVEIALDGGPSRVGVESTVVDCSSDGVRVLRPGGVSRADLQAAIGAPLAMPPADSERRSPGMYARHYAPRAVLKLVSELGAGQPGLTLGTPLSPRQIKMPADPRAYSAALYDSLHRLDRLRVKVIYVQEPPSTPEWEAVIDRLEKASTPPSES